MTTDYHATRFTPDPRRDLLWRTLWNAYFSKYVRPSDTVLDLGSGYGSFINTVVATRRIAVDAWPGMLAHLHAGIEGVVGSVTDLSFLPDESVDFAFASNLLEHLTRTDIDALFAALRRTLKRGGTLTLLQPNYRYAYREYFDDYTHATVFSDRSLRDLLEVSGFDVIECRPRFLPLTVKSRLPVSPSLIRAYLGSPIKPLGKQMLLRARVMKS